jgi:glycosyltransferase involved in cell wall biosynthesis
MKIVHLLAGAGPMYCGSCIHGNTLAAGLRKAGADILLAPIYTPLRTDEQNVSIDRLAMGGINVYMDEVVPIWRRMPAFVRRLLDRPSIVSWVARRGSRTRPEQLGRLALAMFRGDDGSLKNEVHQLIDWLEAEGRPDIVHLSNVMLAGLARPLRERLNATVIATLSGEDGFLEKLPAPYYAQARAELRARAADLSGLVSMCNYYADFMAGYLAVPREKIDVIQPGLNLDGFPPPSLDGVKSLVAGPQPGRPKTIGFFSRICHDKGLHLLIDTLRAMEKGDALPQFRLRVAGYLDPPDRAYLEGLQKRITAWGMADQFEYLGEVDHAGKIAFFESLDVLCLPTLIAESKGLPVLEAWACGVPAVLPDEGAFSEMIAETGGGLLYDPRRPEGLAEALGRMLREEAFAAECGRRAHRAVHERYTSHREARDVLALYERLHASRPVSPSGK